MSAYSIGIEAQMKHRHKPLRIIFIYIPLGYIAASILLVVMLKWLPLVGTPLMLKRCFDGTIAKNTKTEYKWRPIDKVSPNMIRSVIASEDQKFLTHNGFDIEEIKKMRQRHLKTGSPVRGCSTISQQTAKNCFTFGSHSWVRKAFEAYYTILIEKIWGKERIMEVYLNIIELGPKVYGVEAAAQKYYNHTAAKLTAGEAATLTCCLPNPLRRTPNWVNSHMSSRRSEIIRMAGQQDIRPLQDK